MDSVSQLFHFFLVLKMSPKKKTHFSGTDQEHFSHVLAGCTSYTKENQKKQQHRNELNNLTKERFLDIIIICKTKYETILIKHFPCFEFAIIMNCLYRNIR